MVLKFYFTQASCLEFRVTGDADNECFKLHGSDNITIECEKVMLRLCFSNKFLFHFVIHINIKGDSGRKNGKRTSLFEALQ